MKSFDHEMNAVSIVIASVTLGRNFWADALVSLHELSLDMLYKMSSLPSTLGEIKGLRRLTVARCNLTANVLPFEPIPREVASLPSLKYLNMSGSSLPGLPPELLSRDDVEIVGVPPEPYSAEDYSAPHTPTAEEVKAAIFSDLQPPSDYLAFLEDEDGFDLLEACGEYHLLTHQLPEEELTILGIDPEALADVAFVLRGADGDLVAYWRHDNSMSWQDAPTVHVTNEGDAYLTGYNLAEHLLFMTFDDEQTERARIAALAKKHGIVIRRGAGERLELEGIDPGVALLKI